MKYKDSQHVETATDSETSKKYKVSLSHNKNIKWLPSSKLSYVTNVNSVYSSQTNSAGSPSEEVENTTKIDPQKKQFKTIYKVSSNVKPINHDHEMTPLKIIYKK